MTIEQKKTGPQTTLKQRLLLFRLWEETGNVTEACKQAQVNRSTFYYWKTRFQEGGYPALEEPLSSRPKRTRLTPPRVEKLVIELKQENPTWGKRQIANELANRYPELSLSSRTVRRILVDAGLWQTPQ